MKPTKLTVPDLKLLNLVLGCGHQIERAWPYSDLIVAQNRLREFVGLVENLSRAESEELRRLSGHTKHLSESMTARHLAGFLVAFERLSNRALRDDEFLVVEGDRPAPPSSTPEPVMVIADNIRSAFNVGAIFRTAECFNIQEILLTGYTATPDDEKTARTSMGTAASVEWRSVRETSLAVTEAKLRGFSVVALETVDTAVDIDEFVWPERCAILVGNERFGVDREALARADHIVKIPLFGKKNSLNVGISLGIALHSRFQKPRATQSDATQSEASTKWELKPIGIFHSQSVHPYEAPRQATEDQSELEGIIELHSNFPAGASDERSGDASIRNLGLEQALTDLDGFDRIWLLYRFHHNENWKPMVVPPRGPAVKRGVFATRAPYRPNAIGLSAVRLIRVEGRRLFVRGFDLLDQTPIYDIKPYLAYADSHPEAALGWLEGLDEQANKIRFSPAAEAQMDWLEANGVSQLRGFLASQLRFDALDSERKRISNSEIKGMHEIAYRTWRVSFFFDPDLKSISILSIYSGYSDDELLPESVENPHGDKDLHIAFNRRP